MLLEICSVVIMFTRIMKFIMKKNYEILHYTGLRIGAVAGTPNVSPRVLDYQTINQNLRPGCPPEYQNELAESFRPNNFFLAFPFSIKASV